MPDPITPSGFCSKHSPNDPIDHECRICFPPAPSKEAMAILGQLDWAPWDEQLRKRIALAIDAHAAKAVAAKDAEIKTLRKQLRLAMEARKAWFDAFEDKIPVSLSAFEAAGDADDALRASGVKLEDTP